MSIALASDDDPFEDVIRFITSQPTPDEIISYELPESLIEHM
jgi:hypothetical protein